MAKQATPKTDVLSIGFNFDVRHKDPSNPEATEQLYRDQVNIDFRDEQSLNRILGEKPYLTNVILFLIEKMTSDLAASNTAGTALKSKVTEILSA